MLKHTTLVLNRTKIAKVGDELDGRDNPRTKIAKVDEFDGRGKFHSKFNM